LSWPPPESAWSAEHPEAKKRVQEITGGRLFVIRSEEQYRFWLQRMGLSVDAVWQAPDVGERPGIEWTCWDPGRSARQQSEKGPAAHGPSAARVKEADCGMLGDDVRIVRSEIPGGMLQPDRAAAGRVRSGAAGRAVCRFLASCGSYGQPAGGGTVEPGELN
jgi:hypothetical protein